MTAASLASDPQRVEYPIVAQGIEELRELIGKELGPSDTLEVTQQMVQTFADVTDDHQWIHVDVDRATKEGPFGGPIAHGFLVLSLAPPLLFKNLINVRGFSAALNYGANKIRFVAPAMVGAKLSVTAVLDRVDDKAKGHLATFTVTFTAEGSERPSCIAEILVLFVP